MLASQPKLLAEAQPFFQAFCRLQGSRRPGYNEIGAIPMSEISSYFDVFRINNLDMRDRYVKLITACDRAYLEAQEKKSGTGNKSKGRSGQPAGGTGRPPSARSA